MESAGHDVAAEVNHGDTPPAPPIPENKRILFIGLWGGLRCIYGKQRSYLKI
jgi:hypothetical protein